MTGRIFMYLRILNQTLAEGNTNYNDGRFIRDKAIGQRFVGERSVYTYVATLPCKIEHSALLRNRAPKWMTITEQTYPR